LLGKAAEPYYDLWSLAVTLAEAITGRNPALGLTAAETMERIGLGRIPDLRDLLPSCPKDVAAFFRDALSLERSRRPGSAREMKARLLWLRTEMSLSL
jgi:hypothetical protein